MRVMGLDVGTKTVGVAISDPLHLTAQPIETIRYQSNTAAFKRILSLVREYEVTKLVVGLPLNMNVSEGPQAEFVRNFTKELKNLSSTLESLETLFLDERLSSVGAERSLMEADLSRAKR